MKKTKRPINTIVDSKSNPLAIIFMVVAVLITASSIEASQLAGSRPNIVIVMPDDISYGLMQAYGGKDPTPNLDRLYHKSLRFEDFHVSPTCAPTRSAMLTGRHECYAGVTHTINMRERMSLQSRTLVNMLSDAGYATGIFGKWHLGDEEAYRPEKRGFDEVYIHGAGGIGQNYDHSADYPNNDYNNPVLYHNGKSIETTGYCTDLFFDQAIRWMKEQQAKGKPFFCYVPLNVNHRPYIPPLLPDGTYGGKGSVEKNLDDNVGKMTAFLESSGLSENTLYIFMAENGADSGNKNLRGNKADVYEGGTRVPCFFYWKGKVEGGMECHKLTGHIDYYATFAELAGSKDPVPGGKDWDGRSLLPLMENPNAEWPERYWISHKTRWSNKESPKYSGAAIRDSRYKLVYNKNQIELYDLQTDLQEKNNIIDQHPEIASRFKAHYELWWTDIQPYLVNDNLTDFPKSLKPFHDLYRRDFGEEKFQAALAAMTWEGSKTGPGKKSKKK